MADQGGERHESASPEPGSPAGGEVARILLVDDVRRLIELMTHYLNRTTCRILTARSGEETLRVCRRERPDLIFLDDTMSAGGGMEVCRSLKADPLLRHVPVVIVANRDRAADCRAAGCDDVLTKPVGKEEFLERVRRYVALRERVEERIPASLRVEVGALSGTDTTFTKDISAHGLFLKTRRSYAPGARLRLAIHLPRGRQPVRLEAVVRRVVVPAPGSHMLAGIGVQFTRMAPEVDRALAEYIAGRRAR